MAEPETITLLLREVANGNKAALDRLIPLVYDELRVSRTVNCGGKGPVTRCNPPRWSTKCTHAWYAADSRTTATGHISWGWPRRPCARS